MKRLLAFLLLATSAFGTTSVTGNIKNLGVGAIAGPGAFVRFWLRNCGNNIPRVAGTGIIGPSQNGVYYFDMVADANGAISGTLYSNTDAAGTGNGDIECGGVKNATWYGMQAYNGGFVSKEIPITAKNTATIDVSNVTPNSTSPVLIPPTGDNTYCRLDGGNCGFTGPVTALSLNSILFADQYAGADMGAKINTAYAALPATGGKIIVPNASSCYSFTTPIVLNTSGKTVEIDFNNACLNYTASGGTALTLDTGIVTSSSNSKIENLRLKSTVAGQVGTGLSVGPTNGCKFCVMENLDITGFKVLARSASLFNKWNDVVLQSCSTAASSIAYQFISPGDDDSWNRGFIGVCNTLIDLSGGTNGPLTMHGTILAGPANHHLLNNATPVNAYEVHWVTAGSFAAGNPSPLWFEMPNCCGILNSFGGRFEDNYDNTGGPATTSLATAAGGFLNMYGSEIVGNANHSVTQFVTLSGSANARFVDVMNDSFIGGVLKIGKLWNEAYANAALSVTEFGTQGFSQTASSTIGRNGAYRIAGAESVDPTISGDIYFYNKSGVGASVRSGSNIINIIGGGNVFGIQTTPGTNVFQVGSTGAVTMTAGLSGATTGSFSTSVSIGGGTALTTTNQTGSGSLVLATSPTITSPAVATGMAADASGFKHKRGTAGCATAASVGATCTTTVTWTTAFADANYSAKCGGRLVTSGVPLDGGITAQVGASVTFQTVAGTAAAAQYTNIDCSAVHD